MSELQLIYDRLHNACCPEDIFGSASEVAASFKQLARACHPDLHQEPLANKTFQKLNSLKLIADDRIKKGQWGKRIPLPQCLPIKIGAYKVNANLIIGDIADIYRVSGKELCVKVARHHDDNDLLRAEAEALQTLAKIDGPVRKGIPEIVSRFQIDGIRKREVNVIEYFPGFISGTDVYKRLEDKQVSKKTGVWMFKRILSVLSWAHHFHITHGAILPPHVLFYPDNDGGLGRDPRKHTVRLIDWCYSVNFKNRTRLSSWVPAWKDHYAPELLEKKSIGPASDIYMAAQLITYLCGTLWMPELGKVLKKCLDKDLAKRYQKAGDALNDWKEAAQQAFGTPKWVEFNLPQSNP